MGRDRTGSFKRTDRGLYARVTWIDSHGKRRERQRKTISGTTREARRLISTVIVFYAFDLLHAEGEDLTRKQLIERKITTEEDSSFNLTIPKAAH